MQCCRSLLPKPELYLQFLESCSHLGCNSPPLSVSYITYVCVYILYVHTHTRVCWKDGVVLGAHLTNPCPQRSVLGPSSPLSFWDSGLFSRENWICKGGCSLPVFTGRGGSRSLMTFPFGGRHSGAMPCVFRARSVMQEPSKDSLKVKRAGS